MSLIMPRACAVCRGCCWRATDPRCTRGGRLWRVVAGVTDAQLDNHLALVTPSRMAALLEQAKALAAEFDALYTMHKKVGAVAVVAWVGSR